MLKHHQILKKLFLVSTDTLIFQSKLRGHLVGGIKYNNLVIKCRIILSNVWFEILDGLWIIYPIICLSDEINYHIYRMKQLIPRLLIMEFQVANQTTP